MARPKKQKEETRTHCIMLRLNNLEYDYISEQAKKNHYPIAVYARTRMMEHPAPVKYEIIADLEELKILTTEFGRIGNNLNQIAKYFNAGGSRSLAMEDEIHECISQLFILRKQVLRLAGDFHGSNKTHR